MTRKVRRRQVELAEARKARRAASGATRMMLTFFLVLQQLSRLRRQWLLQYPRQRQRPRLRPRLR